MPAWAWVSISDLGCLLPVDSEAGWGPQCPCFFPGLGFRQGTPLSLLVTYSPSPPSPHQAHQWTSQGGGVEGVARPAHRLCLSCSATIFACPSPQKPYLPLISPPSPYLQLAGQRARGLLPQKCPSRPLACALGRARVPAGIFRKGCTCHRAVSCPWWVPTPESCLPCCGPHSFPSPWKPLLPSLPGHLLLIFQDPVQVSLAQKSSLLSSASCPSVLGAEGALALAPVPHGGPVGACYNLGAPGAETWLLHP